ncbi:MULTISPECIES: NUDIX hydrolase [Methylobacterium]|jgi:8-oxo-dGTP pyrophosphatase MutT (NUDIX family)|uniref:NUDIX hydrolase n=1 Tax=Methylobacterium TaxID=407 RepID=UPI000C607CE6|nr:MULTISPECIES: NUDIX hydrolase [Methylobacterium]MBP30133.1 NUDIX hydrolase [Methylobacterium sp.]MDH3029850.1 NUDIX hydrolase [Methylobacterium fujisawaense]RUP11874.1 MAG: NUDIX hydrolase [Methylobacterium sp.]
MSDGFRITQLAAVTARFVTYDWAFPRENAAAIAAHWQTRIARAPGMFDGTVLLCCDHAVADRAARLDLFATRYATFTYYRDTRHADARIADARIANAFAAIVPWTSDGAVLLGEMGARTANAGQLYFPCGTPDPDDIQGARVDLAGSAARELAEETGLALPDEAETDWVLLEGEGQLAFLRPVRFPETAARLVARIADHLGAEAEPELAGMHVVRGRDDIDAARMPGFVRAYLADAFPPAR